MKKILFIFVALFSLNSFAQAGCKDGYALEESGSLEGTQLYKCKKVWCVDLETGDSMGNGNSASSGYLDTKEPQELAAYKETVNCFGERYWCGNGSKGDFDETKGRYVHPEKADEYISYKDGNCFAWKDKKEKKQTVKEEKLQKGRGASFRRTAGVRF